MILASAVGGRPLQNCERVSEQLCYDFVPALISKITVHRDRLGTRNCRSQLLSPAAAVTRNWEVAVS